MRSSLNLSIISEDRVLPTLLPHTFCRFQKVSFRQRCLLITTSVLVKPHAHWNCRSFRASMLSRVPLKVIDCVHTGHLTCSQQLLHRMCWLRHTKTNRFSRSQQKQVYFLRMSYPSTGVRWASPTLICAGRLPNLIFNLFQNTFNTLVALCKLPALFSVNASVCVQSTVTSWSFACNANVLLRLGLRS